MTRLLVEVIKHTAKEDAKASGEAPAPAKKDQSLSKLKIDQVASKDKRVSIHVNLKVPQDKQDPNIITNTARIDADLPTIKYAPENGAKSVELCSHLGRPNGEKNQGAP